jgi:SAM-dependent methyltransferase
MSAVLAGPYSWLMDMRGQRTWDELGRSDPLWAVLSLPEKRGGGWEIDEFLATGVREVSDVLDSVEALGIGLSRGKALDFGCGVGRLTQPLAGRFAEATGVDIAPSMIEMATRLNKLGDRCRYMLNTRGDLSVFADGQFDFIYSSITLQHIPPKLMKNYVAEFVRTLAPAGVIVFQLPSSPPRTLRNRVKRLVPVSVRNRLRRFRHGLRPQARMQMFWMTPRRVERIVRRSGGRIVAMHDDYAAGSGWTGKRYVVRRREAAAP